MLTQKALAGPFDIQISLPGNLPSYNLPTLLETLLQFTFGIIALLAFISIIYSGFIIITSGGDVSKSAQARKNLIWSIIGVVLASLSFVIVRFVYLLGSGLSG